MLCSRVFFPNNNQGFYSLYINAWLRAMSRDVFSMRITRFADESSKVFNIARSPPASLLFKGQGTKHTTVKWPFFGVFSLP